MLLCCCSVVLLLCCRMYMLISKWAQTLFRNGESPNGNFVGFCKGITIWKRNPHMENIHIWWFFSLTPKCARSLFGNGLVTELVPIWKRGRVNPCLCMGISIWKQGAISFDPHMEMRTPHFHMGICHSPFPFGDPRMWSPYGNSLFPFPYGDVSIPVSTWRLPYGNREQILMILHMEMEFPICIWGCVNPRFHMGIPVWKRGAISYDSP